MTTYSPRQQKDRLSRIQWRARRAKLRALRLPRQERARFIYEQTFENEIEAVAYPLWLRSGNIPDLANPAGYTALMRSLWLTHPNPLWPGVADKITMRDYVALHDVSIKPPDLLAVHEDAATLDLSTLPQAAMLKVSNGCNMNLLHTPESPITPRRYRKFLRDRWPYDHWRRYSELHYRDIPRRLLVEEALRPAREIVETNIFCAMGTPYLMYLAKGKVCGYHGLRDGTGVLIQDSVALEPSDLPEPQLLEEMIDVARVLSQSLFHTRVDFMQVGDRVVLGEITLSPGAYMHTLATPEAEAFRASLLDPSRLPEYLDAGQRIAAKLGWPQDVSFGKFANDPRLQTAGQPPLPKVA